MHFSDLWQEFFQTEQMTAHMVNNISGPTLDGLPVNIYVYSLVALFVLAWIMHDIFRQIPLDFKDLGRKILLIVFVLWLVMEARTSLDYLSYLKTDLVNFTGKSLDERHALISPPGLVEFAKFVKEEIPAGRKIALLYPESAYLDIKMDYYLHPYERVSVEQADYVAGYMLYPKVKAHKYSRYGWIIKK